jgi:CBS-domain-containing membrane protein
MARDVRCCSEQDSLDVAHRVMREHQIRRLPVVDDQGVLVGVVALSDLARCTEREGQDATKRKVADALLESFLAVSRPRSLEADVVLVPQDAGARGGRPAGGARSAGAKTTKSAKSGKGSKKR